MNKLTPEALRALASDPDQLFWRDRAVQALLWAADTLAAAEFALLEKRQADSNAERRNGT